MTTVLHLNKAYYPHTGGIEAVAQALAEGLTQRGDFSCQVLACAGGMRTQNTVVNGVPVTLAGSLGTVASLPLSPSYPLWLYRQRAQIVHVHLPFPLADLSLRLLAGLGRLPSSTKVVLHWHSDVVRQQWAMPVYGLLLRWLIRRAERVIVASPNHITSSAFLPDVRDKCAVVPYGIDPSRFEPTHATATRALELRREFGDRQVLFVGRLVYYKGVADLVRSMAAIPEASLLIAGTGPLRASLEGLARELAIADRVHFLGAVTDAELAALYHAASVFVLPSVERSEAFGIVQLEAMVCGKPVVSTDLPTGVTYVNQDGVTGIVVPVHDPERLGLAIRGLLDDQSTAARMGSAARKRVLAEFTVDRMIEQTERVYREVLGRP